MATPPISSDPALAGLRAAYTNGDADAEDADQHPAMRFHLAGSLATKIPEMMTPMKAVLALTIEARPPSQTAGHRRSG